MNKPSDQSGSRYLIVTLSFPEGEIVRLEISDKSGRRYDLPDWEFAASRDDCDDEEPFPVLDNAYSTGFYDANDDFEFDDNEGEFAGDREPVAANTAMSHRLNCREIKELILGRLLKREFVKPRFH